MSLNTIRRPLAVWEHHLLVYRRVWRSNMAGSVIRPFFYLLGMGYGVGGLVDRGERAGDALAGLTYFQFFAPAMIATTAMMVLVQDSLWPIRGGFIWNRSFHSQVASPITPGGVVAGTAAWHFTKGLLAAGGVAVVLALFPSTRSLGLVPAVAFGALTGVAFAAPITAWAAWRDQDTSFANVMRFVITPMFLFGGAFYPISELPGPMRVFSQLTPIWHGVELCRGSVFGGLSATAGLAHVGYLVLWAAVGWWFARRAFAGKLTA